MRIIWNNFFIWNWIVCMPTDQLKPNKEIEECMFRSLVCPCTPDFLMSPTKATWLDHWPQTCLPLNPEAFVARAAGELNQAVVSFHGEGLGTMVCWWKIDRWMQLTIYNFHPTFYSTDCLGFIAWCSSWPWLGGGFKSSHVIFCWEMTRPGWQPDTTTELTSLCSCDMAKIPAWRRQMRPGRKTMCVNCVVIGETVSRIVPWPGWEMQGWESIRKIFRLEADVKRGKIAMMRHMLACSMYCNSSLCPTLPN